MGWATVITLYMVVITMLLVPGSESKPDAAASFRQRRDEMIKINMEKQQAAIDDIVEQFKVDHSQAIRDFTHKKIDATMDLVDEIRHERSDEIEKHILDQFTGTKAVELFKTIEQNVTREFDSKVMEYKRNVEQTLQEMETVKTNITDLHQKFDGLIQDGYDDTKAQDTTCLLGWSELPSDKCVKVFNNGVDWETANKSCPAGGKLVEIETHIENILVAKLVLKSRKKEYCFWIGLADLTASLTWQLSGGRDAHYFRWYKKQPNGGKVKNCACIGYKESSKWVDEECKERKNMGYVCQTDKQFSQLKTTY